MNIAKFLGVPILKNICARQSLFHWQFLITYTFSVSLKFRVCYIIGQLGKFTVKNAIYIYFLCIFCCFLSKNMCFYHFHFFFCWSIELPQKNSHRSETGIGDKKLSVELYVTLAMDIMISISHGESTFGFCHQILIKL